jgi:hypothetical protein
MKRFTLILAGALAVQLALALLLTLGGSDYGSFKANEPLVAFDKAKIDEIAIDQTGGNSVTLKKAGGKWIVPAMAEFPADERQIGTMLDKMAELKKGWPVATTSDAADRFKVTADNHERRVVLKSGGSEAGTLLIGTAPTFRQANIRTGSDSNVYSAELAAHEFGARGEEWLDRGVLSLPQDKVASIAIGDVTLEKKDGKFTVSALKDGETVKAAEIPPVVSTVTSPTFDTVQGKGDEALAKLEPADFQVTVTREGAEPVTYKYKKEAAGDAYLFASSLQPFVFRVSGASVKALAEAKREKLVAVKAPDAPKPPEPEAPKAPDQPPPAAPQPDSTGG